MGRTNYVLSSPGFVVDPESVILNSGRQIDWDLVTQFGASGKKHIPAGTIMTQLNSGKIAPRTENLTAAGVVDNVAPAAASLMLATAAHEGAVSDSKSGYGCFVGGVFYSELLPDAGDAEFATFKTELGARFVFDTYEDNRS